MSVSPTWLSTHRELAVIEKPVQQKQKEPPLWDVIILNDDYTPMPFVVDMLVDYFNKSVSAAHGVMMRVHIEGKAVAGRYTKDVAQTKQEKAESCARQAGHPLKILIEKATP